MRCRFAFFFALPLLLIACDSQADEPSALFTAEVTDPEGAPVEGLDLYVAYPLFDAARGSAGGGAVTVYPNPAVRRAGISLSVLEAQRIALRLYDLDSTLVVTLSDQVYAAGQHAHVVDLAGLEGGEGGVYRVVAEGETFEAETYLVHSTGHREFDAVTFHLGTTDEEGRVTVDERARFPSLYDLPGIEVADEEGNPLGLLGFEDDVEFVLVAADSTDQAEDFELDETGNVAELTWDP